MTILSTLPPDSRWTKDEHAEMALLVLTHSMSSTQREAFLFDLGITSKEYEYLTEKYSRPLAKLNEKEHSND